MRKLIALLALVAGIAVAVPAHATCVPGRVGVDPKTHKVYLELPECHPYE